MPVTSFLCTAEEAEAVGADPARGELLLVAEEEGAVSLGLYVSPEAQAALRGHRAEASEVGRFQAYCLAAEGVSHFVYLVFRHGQTRSVSQLELELQAEIDKYASALLEGNGGAPFRVRPLAIRRRLYERPALIDAPGTEEGDRYRHAIRFAARYAARLHRRYVDRGQVGALVAELRRFYRAGMREKLALLNAA